MADVRTVNTQASSYSFHQCLLAPAVPRAVLDTAYTAVRLTGRRTILPSKSQEEEHNCQDREALSLHLYPPHLSPSSARACKTQVPEGPASGGPAPSALDTANETSRLELGRSLVGAAMC